MKLLTDRLSAREKDVLRLLAKGLIHEQVGEKYGVTASAVTYWMKEVREKLDAKTTVQAVVIALTAGIIE